MCIFKMVTYYWFLGDICHWSFIAFICVQICVIFLNFILCHFPVFVSMLILYVVCLFYFYLDLTLD